MPSLGPDRPQCASLRGTGIILPMAFYSAFGINVNAQVMDMNGNVIPGLYAAGESASAISMHGLAKGVIFGRLAAMHAAKQPSAG